MSLPFYDVAPTVICLYLWKYTFLITIVCLYSIKKHESYSAPIKAKDEMLFHVGFRQFVARYSFLRMSRVTELLDFLLLCIVNSYCKISVGCRPIFSSDNINSDKHKMERFLHAGRFSIASIYAPISFPPLPLIALKTDGESTSLAVAAVGSLRSIDPDRIILKKIILTG